MEISRLTPDLFRESLQSGCDYLELNREILDNLNVYPVPDGDTGINMLSTFKPAIEELTGSLHAAFTDISKVMKATLTGNSRGNSGFILAQFFRGFWEAMEKPEIDHIDANALRNGFAQGDFTAVSSLLSPVDG